MPPDPRDDGLIERDAGVADLPRGHRRREPLRLNQPVQQVEPCHRDSRILAPAGLKWPSKTHRHESEEAESKDQAPLHGGPGDMLGSHWRIDVHAALLIQKPSRFASKPRATAPRAGSSVPRRGKLEAPGEVPLLGECRMP